MTELRLSKPEIIKLIEIYKQNECLWNTNSVLYKKYELKQKVWEGLAEEFETSVDLVKKKIKFLRTSFSAEKKKVESSKKSCSGRDVYIPNLFYYNNFSFLKSTILTKDSIESVLSEKSVECPKKNELESDLSDKDVLAAPSAKKAKQSSRLKYDKGLEGIIAAAKDQEPHETDPADMFLAFGNSIGMQLKQLPILSAARVMSDIQNLMSDAIIFHFKSRSNESQQNLSMALSFCYSNDKSPSEKILPESIISSDSNLDVVKLEDVFN